MLVSLGSDVDCNSNIIKLEKEKSHSMWWFVLLLLFSHTKYRLKEFFFNLYTSILFSFFPSSLPTFLSFLSSLVSTRVGGGVSLGSCNIEILWWDWCPVTCVTQKHSYSIRLVFCNLCNTVALMSLVSCNLCNTEMIEWDCGPVIHIQKTACNAMLNLCIMINHSWMRCHTQKR